MMSTTPQSADNISQILLQLADKSVNELTLIHNQLPYVPITQKDQLILEILAKTIQSPESQLVALNKLVYNSAPADKVVEDLIKNIRIRLKNACPSTDYHRFFSSNLPNRLNGRTLLQFIDFPEFQTLVNNSYLTRYDFLCNNRSMLYYLAECGKLEYFQFLLDRRCFALRDIILDRYELICRAAQFNHFVLVEWLITTYQTSQTRLHLYPMTLKFRENFLLRWAAKQGHLPFLHFLKQSGQLTSHDLQSCDNEAIKNAMFYRYPEVVAFLELWIKETCPHYQLPVLIPENNRFQPEQQRWVGLHDFANSESETDLTSPLSDATTNQTMNIVLDNFDQFHSIPVTDCQYNGICPICQFSFLYYQDNQTMAQIDLSLTPCRHLFHQKCLTYAIQSKDLSCPTCQQIMSSEIKTIAITTETTLEQASELLRQTASFSLGQN